jgi:hypothetical protein
VGVAAGGMAAAAAEAMVAAVAEAMTAAQVTLAAVGAAAAEAIMVAEVAAAAVAAWACGWEAAQAAVEAVDPAGNGTRPGASGPTVSRSGRLRSTSVDLAMESAPLVSDWRLSYPPRRTNQLHGLAQSAGGGPI